MQEFKKKKHSSGTTTSIISYEKMNDIMKIVKALEDSNILSKGVTKTIKNEIKDQKGGFLSMLLGTLGASLLRNLLTGKGISTAGSGNKKGKGILRAGSGRHLFSASENNKKKKRNSKSWYWKRMGFLMPPHPLTNFEYRNIIKMNQNLMVFFQEIIYLKK